MTHKVEIQYFHNVEFEVVHKSGCQVGFDSREFHCNLIYIKFKNYAKCHYIM